MYDPGQSILTPKSPNCINTFSFVNEIIQSLAKSVSAFLRAQRTALAAALGTHFILPQGQTAREINNHVIDNAS